MTQDTSKRHLDVDLDLAASVDKLPQVVDPLRQGLSIFQCPHPTIDKIVVAVEELFVNVASYAYGEDEGAARLRYTFEATEDGGRAGVTVIIEDDGVPFDPVAKPDPTFPTSVDEVKIGGLGILMAKKSTDSMTYERRGDTNVVTLTKSWDC